MHPLHYRPLPSLLPLASSLLKCFPFCFHAIVLSFPTKKIQFFFLKKKLQYEKRTRRLERKLSQQPKQAKDGVWG